MAYIGHSVCQRAPQPQESVPLGIVDLIFYAFIIWLLIVGGGRSNPRLAQKCAAP